MHRLVAMVLLRACTDVPMLPGFFVFPGFRYVDLIISTTNQQRGVLYVLVILEAEQISRTVGLVVTGVFCLSMADSCLQHVSFSSHKYFAVVVGLEFISWRVTACTFPNILCRRNPAGTGPTPRPQATIYGEQQLFW